MSRAMGTALTCEYETGTNTDMTLFLDGSQLVYQAAAKAGAHEAESAAAEADWAEADWAEVVAGLRGQQHIN